MRRVKWMALSALMGAGAMVSEGCLGAFWDGFWNTGWPANNRWLNLAYDVLVEAAVYAP